MQRDTCEPCAPSDLIALVGSQVECEVGAPQVNYRESISRLSDVRSVHKKQSGGSGQFADVAIKFEPGEAGTGFVFRYVPPPFFTS